jgi:hypothetical protein
MSEYQRIIYDFNSRIKLNDETTDPTEVILVDERELMDTISTNVEEELPTEPGIVDYGVKEGKGTVDIPIMLYATTEPKMQELIENMKKALNPDLLEADPTYGDTTKYQGYHPFKWTETVGSTSREFMIYLKSMETPKVYTDSLAGLIRGAKLTLKARDPRKYLQAQSSLTSSGTATNAGTYPTPIEITITASGPTSTSLTITNSTTGKSIVVSTALAGGEALVIDTYLHSVKLAGVERRDYISAASQWIQLNPGANVFSITNSANTTIVTRWYSAWPL